MQTKEISARPTATIWTGAGYKWIAAMAKAMCCRPATKDVKMIAIPFLILVLSTICGWTQTFVALHTFNADDGAGPGLPVQGIDGRLYGLGIRGTNGTGVLFCLNPDGTGFADLRQFSPVLGYNDGGTGAPTNADGDMELDPPAQLVQGYDGKLYGACAHGGLFANGTLFSVDTNGQNFAVLHAFSASDLGNNIDGITPQKLLQANDGQLYGATYGGGTNGTGVIFTIDTSGNNFRVIYTFGGSGTPAAGNGPSGGLIQGNDGKLYGSTSQYGVGGTVFSLNTDGSAFTYLHVGGNVAGLLIQGGDGKLYGTTIVDGLYNLGTIFTINTNGGSSFSVIHNFGDPGYPNPDGYPRCGLLQASDGKLYGETQGGDVFSVDTNSDEYNIICTLGSTSSGLLQGRDGGLYTCGSPNGELYGSIVKLPATHLKIARSGSSNLAVSWPTWANGYYTLQTNRSVSTSGWAAVSDGIATATNNFVLTSTPVSNAEFFRLH